MDDLVFLLFLAFFLKRRFFRITSSLPHGSQAKVQYQLKLNLFHDHRFQFNI